MALDTHGTRTAIESTLKMQPQLHKSQIYKCKTHKVTYFLPSCNEGKAHILTYYLPMCDQAYIPPMLSSTHPAYIKSQASKLVPKGLKTSLQHSGKLSAWGKVALKVRGIFVLAEWFSTFNPNVHYHNMSLQWWW